MSIVLAGVELGDVTVVAGEDWKEEAQHALVKSESPGHRVTDPPLCRPMPFGSFSWEEKTQENFKLRIIINNQ